MSERETCNQGKQIFSPANVRSATALFGLAALLLGASPATASAQASLLPEDVSRLLVGETAIEIRTAEDGQLRLALADSDRVIVLTVRARDAQRWADSVDLIVRAKAQSKRVPKEWTVILEEPGLQAGSLSLTRRDGETGSRWSLFAADKAFDEIRMGIAPGEARALLAAVRRGASALLPPPTSRSRKRPRGPVRPTSTHH